MKMVVMMMMVMVMLLCWCRQLLMQSVVCRAQKLLQTAVLLLLLGYLSWRRDVWSNNWWRWRYLDHFRRTSTSHLQLLPEM
uniref:Putative secreted protein n=1 Tax=Anopheles triannulatus TaxID=58253 RepID=A0A2M4B1N7_9DIPT